MEGLENKTGQPVQISSLKGMRPYAESVVRYTRDGGKTWRYGRLGKAAELKTVFTSGAHGAQIYEEVSPKGVHGIFSLTERYFQEPGLLYSLLLQMRLLKNNSPMRIL